MVDVTIHKTRQLIKQKCLVPASKDQKRNDSADSFGIDGAEVKHRAWLAW